MVCTIAGTRAYRSHFSTSTSSESNRLTDYFLGNDSEEVSRLNQQYIFVKTLFDYPQLVPPGIDIARVSRVIDVGAGTGVWALDFVSLPGVYDRDDIQVFACDISTAKFPNKNGPEVGKIKFFQQDVTKPFPDELIGTFDLINFSFVAYAFTTPGWQVALRNLYSLLKPGGYLFLRDSDMITCNRENPPPSGPREPNIRASLQGTSNVATINRILVGEALKRDFVVGLSYYLQTMLEEASFMVLSSQRIPAPFGNYCDFYRSRTGAPLSENKPFTISNYVRPLNAITQAATKGGVLELADGSCISTEEERLALMDKITRSVMEGGYMMVSDWVAVRPLEPCDCTCHKLQKPRGHAT